MPKPAAAPGSTRTASAAEPVHGNTVTEPSTPAAESAVKVPRRGQRGVEAASERHYGWLVAVRGFVYQIDEKAAARTTGVNSSSALQRKNSKHDLISRVHPQ
jgi:hypothetical protein